MNATKIIAAGTIVVAGFPTGVSAAAAPLEGGGVDRPPCSTTERFFLEATTGHAAAKAKAIVGLTGPDADEALAEVRRDVSEHCS